jgi:hypothetical protein
VRSSRPSSRIPAVTIASSGGDGLELTAARDWQYVPTKRNVSGDFPIDCGDPDIVPLYWNGVGGNSISWAAMRPSGRSSAAAFPCRIRRTPMTAGSMSSISGAGKFGRVDPSVAPVRAHRIFAQATFAVLPFSQATSLSNCPKPARTEPSAVCRFRMATAENVAR